MFDQEHLKELKVGLVLFNQEKFWECHECLEDLWADYSHSHLKYISWSIIQVATALYHVRNRNLSGAQGMLSKAKEKLKKCEEHKLENNLLQLSMNWQTFKHLVFQINQSDDLAAFDALYRFKFPEVL